MTLARPVLVERVAACADAALASLAPGDTRARVQRVRTRLGEPLRVAIAGREKAGKSTFVNALLGENIAPTDAGVCTRVVTWYRYANDQGVEILRRGGETRQAPLRRDSDGQAVIDLGADPSEIERLTVYLPNSALADLTIIDTPGLSSIAEKDSAGTRDVLFQDQASREASDKADALVFMLAPTAMSDDRAALADFSERFGGLSGSAGNALGIISRADQIGDGRGDPWAQAEAMAESRSEVLAGLVACVTPLVGLLAESASHLRASDVTALTELSVVLDELPATMRETLLFDPSLLVEYECSVPRATRERLVAMFGRYGLATILPAIADGERAPGRVVARMRRLSGIERVSEIVRTTFRERSDALRARAAMAELGTISWLPDPVNRAALGDLRDELEVLELDPAMHRIAEISAGQAAAATITSLPPALRADLHRLLSEVDAVARLGRPDDTSPGNLARLAADGERAWLALANDPGMPLRIRRVAAVFARSHGLLYEALTRSSGRAAS